MNAVTNPVTAGATNLRILSYAEAIREAMAIAMQADPTVILMGEDIGVYGGAFQVTLDLVDRFGPDRVMDTPISELGGAGVAVGAALTGLKPIFEFQFSDLPCWRWSRSSIRRRNCATCLGVRLRFLWYSVCPPGPAPGPPPSTAKASRPGSAMCRG